MTQSSSELLAASSHMTSESWLAFLGLYGAYPFFDLPPYSQITVWVEPLAFSAPPYTLVGKGVG